MLCRRGSPWCKMESGGPTEPAGAAGLRPRPPLESIPIWYEGSGMASGAGYAFSKPLE